MALQPCAEALVVHSGDGHVFVEAECGAVVTLTPGAALATSDLLAYQAARAIGETKMPGYRPPIVD